MTTTGRLASRDAVLAWLIAAAARLLRVPATDIDPRHSIAELGLDSLGALEMLGDLEASIGAAIPLSDVLEAGDLGALATRAWNARAVVAAMPTGEPEPAATATALSAGEQALWMLQSRHPASTAYHLARAVRVHGRLDRAALQAAVDALAALHPALRTRYPMDVDGVPHRAVDAHAAGLLAWVDASAATEAERTAQLRAAAAQPFDLARGPLVVLNAFTEADGGCVLLFRAHHIVMDHWSFAVLLRDLGALYADRLASRESTLVAPVVRFEDAVRDEIAQREGPLFASQRDWWARELAGELPTLSLPTRMPDPRAHDAGMVRAHIGREGLDPIRRLAREHDTTLFVVLLAGFHLALGRHANQDEVVVGSPTSGRTSAAFADVVGYFVHPVALRLSRRDDPTFADFVVRARAAVVGALAHAAIPFPTLIESLGSVDPTARSPVFQASFALQQAHRASSGADAAAALAIADPGARIPFGASTLEVLDAVHPVAPFDVTLTALERDGALSATLEYDAQRFDEDFATRLLDSFVRMVTAGALDPGHRVSTLPWSSEDERARLAAWSVAPRVAYDEPSSLPARIAQHVRDTPDAIAVVCDEAQCTYRALDEQARRVCHALRSRGIGADDVVGVVAERSIGFVVAVLGVLQAGAAYLPLEPSLPAARVAVMTDLARARIVLASAARDVPPGVDLVRLDQLPDAVATATTLDAAQLAYVIFTSGSTGIPRGVGCTHANALHLLQGIDRLAPLARGVRASAWTAFGFDVSVYELFAPLTSGGVLDVLPDRVRTDPDAFFDHLASHAIQSAYVPPFWLEALASRLATKPGSIPLQRLLVGVEPIAMSLLARLRSLVPALVVINGYGPTETTVCCTLYPVPADAPDAGRAPIGRPLPGASAHVLDGHGTRVPIGTTGELCVAGAGVARGYLSQPARTAERFVPDPFAREPGSRMYRTGDAVRWQPGGQLEFVGRQDRQIKIRGLRIEPGDIEAALHALPWVGETVVLPRTDASGENVLVAYLVPATGRVVPAVADLRAALERTLPASMIPGAFVPLTTMPRTVNGKIDVAALPAPSSAGSSAPLQTATEHALAAIWTELLGVQGFGRDDDFFARGGHSLRATRLVGRIAATFGVVLPVTDVFAHPTLRAMASAVDLADRDTMPALIAQPRGAPMRVASYGEERLWLLWKLDRSSVAYGIVGAARLRGELDVAALEGALGDVVARHDVLRTRFEDHDGQLRTTIAPAAPFSLPVDAVDRDAIAHRLATEARRPYDLGCALQLRARLFRIAPDEHVLMLAMHHAVSDGWSLSILVDELRAFHALRTRRSPSQPAPLSHTYGDYAAWQRRVFETPRHARALAWWAGELSSLPPLELATDRPRIARAHRAGTIAFDLPHANALRETARRAGATEFMVLVAAYAALLARYSGQDDFGIGLPAAGRDRPELEPLIGFFVQTLVLRADLSAHPSFHTLLARVRTRALGAFAHADVPFDQVVAAVAAPRRPGITPLFQAFFALQDAPVATNGSDTLAFEPLAIERHVAQFDLALDIDASAQGLRARFEYDADLFDAARIEQYAAHYTRLLEALVHTPDARIDRVDVVSDAERAWLLAHAIGATVAQTPDVLDRVVAQMARRPGAIALHDADGPVTYAALGARVRALAATLTGHGVGLETRVGLLIDRSPDLVVAMLAVLAAGGAFVPVDPANPDARIAWVADDAHAAVWLSGDEHAARLRRVLPDRIVLATGSRAAPVTEALRSPLDAPEALAYVIYTSGSTGQPRGVGVSRRALAVHAAAFVQHAGFDADDRAMQFASPAFDVCLEEIFPTLVAGATLFFRPVGVPEAPEGLLRDLARDGITVLNLPTAYFDTLVREMDGVAGAMPACIRLLVVGGQAADATTLARFGRWAIAPVRWINAYGPTEATVSASSWEAPAAGLEPGRDVPIGRGFGNDRLYVLDAHGALVPRGAPGELYIAGPKLARGYIDRPGVTAARFVPDPFARVAGARMYRTGDRARMRWDGNVEYLGRVDGQVKLRGFRVEPGEIESALHEHPSVREAAVVAIDDGARAMRLAAFVTGDASSSLDPADVRAFVRARLPAYMVPSTVTVLASLPRSAGGKVDRRALVPLEDTERHAATHVAPRTPDESRVAAAFADLLGLDRVGADDDFFERGGHSLLLVRLAARLRADTGLDLPLRALFEAQTVAAMAQRLAEARRDGGSPGRPPLVARPHGAHAPLSFAQERLWMLDRLGVGSAYNIAGALRVRGRFDTQAWQAALDTLVSRHEVLRTRIVEIDGVPHQSIEPDARITMPIVDLARVAASEARTQADALLHATATAPFDLSRAPLLRVATVRLVSDHYLVAIAMHHIVSDGWSIDVMLAELVAAYEAHRAGRRPDLAPLPVQYADYAIWQRGWLAGDALETELASWRARFADAPAALELPTDRPRPAIQTFHGAHRTVCIDAATRASLDAFCRREGLTRFTVFLAVHALLLTRRAGQREVVVGAPIANRSLRELEPLVGFFANTLPLRVDTGADATVRGLLHRVRDLVQEGFAHPDVPLERLIEALSLPRDASRNALFQAALTYQRDAAAMPSLTDASLEFVETSTDSSRFDVALAVIDGSSLTLTLEYNTDLFDAATAADMLRGYQQLLCEVIARPDVRPALLSMLEPPEFERLVHGLNDTHTALPEGLLHAGFFEQAARHPDRVAVIARGRSVTYRDLREHALRVAGTLQASGIVRGAFVAIVLDKGAGAVAALLGTLAVGGVYVPLDPQWPRERSRRLLDRLVAACVLTDASHLQDVIPWLDEVPTLRTVVCVEAFERALDDTRVHTFADLAFMPLLGAEPTGAATVADLAYVIFTSGSTGEPKGVMIDHRGARNTIEDINARFEVTPRDRVFASSSLNFDLSVYDVFGTLGAGATLIVPDPGTSREPAHWAELVHRHGVTLWNSVPALAEMLIEHPAVDLRTLRLVLLSGDWIPVSLPARLRAQAASARIVSLGGATEASIWSIAFPIGPVPASWRSIPYGRPLANQRFYVLDASLQPSPVGVPGQLYIGGIGVAKGYFGDPVRTATSFVPDPFVGGTMYCTGDWGRVLRDGDIEFLGRRDHQVKLRGFRIELGEIEAVLVGCDGVHEAVVRVREDTPGDRRLVGYVVPADERFDLTTLDTQARSRLPEYMIPAAFVVMTALPRTANGKLDRNALPAPGERDEAPRAHVPPRDEIERTIVDAFASVLERPRVSVDDDFFALGGHSLTAVRVAVRLQRDLAIDVPLRTLFASPTAARLASALRASAPIETASSGPLPVPRGDTAPLSFAQERLWALEQLGVGSAYNVPGIVRLTGALDEAALIAALDAVVARHEALRTCFVADAQGRPSQRVSSVARLQTRRVDLAGHDPTARDAAVQALALDEASRAFDLATAPLLRAVLVRREASDHVLVLTLHHLVADGWSLGVLLREVGAFYTAGVTGAAVDLPVLTVQYADYAIWQRAWLVGDVLAQQIASWKTALAGAPPMLELPTDHPRPATQTFRGALQTGRLTATVRDALRAFCAREGVTPFSALLGSWAATLARHAGQRDIVLGTPVANRRWLPVEPLIGFFVNTLPLRVAFAPDATIRTLTAEAHRVALHALAHQDVPFDRLVELLRPVRDPSRSPVFQAMFAYQLEPALPWSLPGLTVAFETEPDPGTAKSDVLLYAVDGDHETTLGLEYNADLFDAGTAARMMQRFVATVAEAVARPDLRVVDLPMLAPDERALLLGAWCRAPSRHDRPVADLYTCFADQAARTPDAPAVLTADVRWTYAELMGRVVAIARCLRARGVVRESLVGVCVARTPWLVASVLAVLAAEGAYVPLDPAYPRARLEAIVDDAGLSLVLADAVGAHALPQRAIGIVEPAEAARSDEAAPLPVRRVVRDARAYVIYTSGSTGRPKGVALAHAGAVALVDWARDTFGAAALARVLGATSVCFDLSVFELFAPLSIGGAVVLAQDAVSLGELPASLRDSITLINTVPSAMAELTRNGAVPSAVRVVNLAGEPLSRALADAVYACPSVEALWNLYGPTEDTTYSTGVHVPRDTTAAPTIGRPLAGSHAYVLDAEWRLVPIGVHGDLYLGGEGLARGYHARPGPTAERFVPDPFAPTPGARMYRTGDRARFRADGELEFLGRRDHQVKLRGFRIELGDVEHALTSLDGVDAAVAIVRDDAPGGRALVAYVTTRGDLDPRALRDALRVRLPAYLVPAAVVVLDELPQTPNGKIDRAALPAPGHTSSATSADTVLPRTPIEVVLHGVWADVLQTTQLGVHDNFFDLGGDSMLALRVAAHAQSAGLVVAPRDLLRHPTIALLATHVVPVRESSTLMRDEPVQPGPVPLTPYQSFHLERVHPAFVDQWNLGGMLRLAPSVATTAVVEAIDRVAEREEVFRLRFRRIDGAWHQYLADNADPPRTDVVDLTDVPEDLRRDELARRVAATATSLDVAHGPVARLVVFDLGPALGRRVLLSMHWLVVDAVSLRILGERVAVAVAQRLRDEPIVLPPRTTRFVDWARSLPHRARANGAATTAYWLDLARRPTPRIPVERPEAPNTHGSTRIATAKLTPALTRRFVARAASQQRSPDVLLAAAYAWAVRLWCGQTSVLLAITSHGRDAREGEPDLSSTIGRIAGFRPAWLDIAACTDPSAAFDAVASQLLEVPGGDASSFAAIDRAQLSDEDRTALDRLARSDTRLDYTGQVFERLDASDVFEPADESAGAEFDPARTRNLVFYFAPRIEASHLVLDLHYSGTQFSDGTVETLLACIRDAILAILGPT